MSCVNHRDKSVYGEYGQRGCIECVESAPKPSKLDEILDKLLEDSHRVPELPFFEFTPYAKSQILALIEEVGIKFLTSCGEEDKIEAWKKYLKTGDQL